MSFHRTFWCIFILQVACACFASADSSTCSSPGDVDGYTYNLAPLAKADTDYGVPIITADQQTTEGFINVCTAIHSTACGANVAGCQIWNGGKAMLGAATPFTYTKAEVSGDDGYGVTLLYSGGEAGRAMKINFICGWNAGSGMPQFTSEVGSTYNFNWVSQYGCPTNASPGGSSGGGGGLSGGSILLIILLCVVVVYIAGGVALNKFARHKEGVEVIPNVDFWVMLPGLVKDGGMFIYHKIRGVSGGGAYQQV